MIQLWNKAKDCVTWFSWIVTSVTTYLTGCDRIVLTPEALNWEIKEWASFDINSCEFIDKWVREKFFPSKVVEEIKEESKKVWWPEIYSHKKAY